MARATIRTPMPVKMRAKQFMMFDAMKGLTEAIMEKEKQNSLRKELAENQIEEINRQLSALNLGDTIVITYYCKRQDASGKMIGKVEKIDVDRKTIQIDNVFINISEIENISILSGKNCDYS